MCKASLKEAAVAANCPVLPLISEHLQVERDHNDADELYPERSGRETILLEQAARDTQALALEKEEILRMHASIVQARSPEGALFQLGVLQHLADDLADMVNNTDLLREEKRRTRAAILRLSHSVAAVLRELCDPKAAVDAGEYYLPPRANPLEALQRAQRAAEALRRDAA